MKTIRILGINYTIIHEPNDENGMNGPGQINSTRCVIRICTTLNSKAHMKSVLLHEIIEALNYRMELELNHQQITSLEAGLFSVINDNPKFVEYLNGR